MVDEHFAAGAKPWQPKLPRRPAFVGTAGSRDFAFEVRGGRVWIDPDVWAERAAAIIARSNGLLKDVNGKPAITVSTQDFLGKDSDMIACEVECRRDGIDGLFVELDIPGLDALVSKKAGA